MDTFCKMIVNRQYIGIGAMILHVCQFHLITDDYWHYKRYEGQSILSADEYLKDISDKKLTVFLIVSIEEHKYKEL